MIPNHYQTLRISPTAPKNEIRKAYRTLALKFHPDKNNSPDAHEQFIAINEAYLILSDDEARIKYDRAYEFYYGQKTRAEQTSATQAATNDQPQTPKYSYSSRREPQFEDEDLNQWTRNAREQAKNFAAMAFGEFSKLLLGMVKETGFQLGNALLVMIGALLAMAGCGNIVMGVSLQGHAGNLVFGVVLLPLGAFLYHLAHKNYSRHKPM